MCISVMVVMERGTKSRLEKNLQFSDPNLKHARIVSKNGNAQIDTIHTSIFLFTFLSLCFKFGFPNFVKP
jgi:hypothetical protein